MELGSLFISLLLAAAGLLAYYFLNRLNYWKKRGIPHDPPHFLHGNFEGLKTKYHQQDIFQATYNKYKGKAPFVGFYFFQQPMAFIISLDLVKNILIKDFSNFSNRSRFYNEKHDPLSAHLFALDNPKWNQLRKKLTPTFTSGKMKFMFPTVLKVAEEFRDAIQKTKEGTSVDIKEFFARFTTDVIGTCAFGIECNSLKDPQAEFRIMGRRAFSEMNLGSITMAFATSYPSIARKLGIIVYPKDVTAFFIKAVKDTVDLREKNNIRRNDFMDMLIELKNKQEENITMEEIAAQAYVFFLAGFETSSTTSGFAMFELALHQDMQDRVRAEINEVLSRYNNEFSYESLKEMTYLDQVISETMRRYSVVPTLVRRAEKDYVVPGHPKFIIEKNTSILIPSFAIHHDPDIYPNPEIFNPDNFSPEKVKARDSVTWLPFGEGPRNCIGLRFGQMQTRLGIAMLLKHFKFTIGPETEIPVKIDKSHHLCVNEGGIYLNVEKLCN